MAKKPAKIKVLGDLKTNELNYFSSNNKPVDPNTIGITFQDVEDLIWGNKVVEIDDEGNRSVDWDAADIFAGTCFEGKVEEEEKERLFLRILEKAKPMGK